MSSKLEKDAAWEASILGTFYKQLCVHPKPLPSHIRLDGQTAIVTGANGGLGFEAARQLLRLGLSRLVVTVRSQRKGEATALKLRTEFPGANIDVSILDLSDYDSVTAFAKRCQQLERIDYAILNAGLQSPKFERNERTDHEVVFQTNYLSTALLMLLLTPIMKEKSRNDKTRKPPVLTAVGSDTMYFADFEASGPIFPRVDDPARYSQFQQYRDSKLFLMMFVARLADQLDPEEIIVSVCNPGMTAGTGFIHDVENAGILDRYIIPLFVKAMGRTGPVGASNYIHALVIGGKESHGGFFSDWAIKP